MESHLQSKAMILQFDGGIKFGKSTVVNRTFSNINVRATDEQIFLTALAISDFQEKQLLKVNKREISSINNG